MEVRKVAEEKKDLLGDVVAVEFAENPEPRQAVALLLDTSGSMNGEPIVELNAGLQAFSEAVKADPLASLRCEVAVVSFGGEVQATEFVGGLDFEPPVLTAGGMTPMGEALLTGLKLLRERKASYKAAGLDYFRPWMLVITDGQPTDDVYDQAAQECIVEEQRKGVIIFPIGVEGARMDILGRISERQPLKLRGVAFVELFVWLSKSVSAVTSGEPGEQVALAPVGWAEADTSTEAD